MTVLVEKLNLLHGQITFGYYLTRFEYENDAMHQELKQFRIHVLRDEIF